MLFKLIRTEFRGTYSNFLNSRGDAYWRSGYLRKAEKYFRDALSANRRNALACSNLGAVLMELHQYDEGFSLLELAARIAPEHSGVQVNLGNAYYRSGQIAKAIHAYQAALNASPGDIAASANLVRPLMEVCDWSGLDRHMAAMRDYSSSKERNWLTLISPYTSLFLPLSREQQLFVARIAAQSWKKSVAGISQGPPQGSGRRSGRLRIGYLSADFHDHATAHLTLGVYGKHDRDRFEIFAYSIGVPDTGSYRRKISDDCDHFFDVHEKSTADIARQIAADQIDILVDMKGYTGGARTGILAMRPAPVQVNYLGYPGTMGADFIDYIVADPIIIPETHAADYAEKVIRLPDTYQPADDLQKVDEASVERSEAGLPENGFVYCCFNTPAKIDRRSFARWMEILRQVPDSVLWLIEASAEVQANLARACETAGIDPRRIVYAKPLPKPKHLARLRLADLVLDTFTYNAHTTASDALWSGVPMVTLTGDTFASRVATSILDAAGLSELAVASEEEYVQLAVSIARDSARKGDIKQALSKRKGRRLFNTSLYVRNLEEAYEEMYKRKLSAITAR